ncbi:hypothetical protein Tco_0499717 [Tanacetum coccineum]
MRRAPRRSEAFRHWCAAPLSTLYPPTTSESSSERPLHSSSHDAGPSRKRCRSLVNSVPLSTPVMGSLAPTRADLLPPRKRFRDLYSSEDSIEEDAEVDPIETRIDIELGIGECGMTGRIPSDSSSTRDGIVRSFEDMPIDLDDAMRDSYQSQCHKFVLTGLSGIKTVQRDSGEADQFDSRGQRVSMIRGLTA